MTDRTCVRVGVVPGCSASSTDAVGASLVVEKTSFFGIAMCTIAVCTPCIACSVLPSSPSSALW